MDKENLSANEMETIMERLSSRKFLTVVGLFIASGMFGWFKPEFVGNAQTLFNFWMMLIALYLGANVGQKWVNKNSK